MEMRMKPKTRRKVVMLAVLLCCAFAFIFAACGSGGGNGGGGGGGGTVINGTPVIPGFVQTAPRDLAELQDRLTDDEWTILRTSAAAQAIAAADMATPELPGMPENFDFVYATKTIDGKSYIFSAMNYGASYASQMFEMQAAAWKQAYAIAPAALDAALEEAGITDFRLDGTGMSFTDSDGYVCFVKVTGSWWFSQAGGSDAGIGREWAVSLPQNLKAVLSSEGYETLIIKIGNNYYARKSMVYYGVSYLLSEYYIKYDGTANAYTFWEKDGSSWETDGYAFPSSELNWELGTIFGEMINLGQDYLTETSYLDINETGTGTVLGRSVKIFEVVEEIWEGADGYRYTFYVDAQTNLILKWTGDMGEGAVTEFDESVTEFGVVGLP